MLLRRAKTIYLFILCYYSTFVEKLALIGEEIDIEVEPIGLEDILNGSLQIKVRVLGRYEENIEKINRKN